MVIKLVNETVVDADDINVSYLGVVPSLTIEMKNITLQNAVSLFSDKGNIAKIRSIEDGQVETYEGFVNLVSVNVLFRSRNVSVTLHKE